MSSIFTNRFKRIAFFTLALTLLVAAILASKSIPGFAAGAPAQIAVAPVAVAADKSATVTWTAPMDNGSPITSYTVTSNPGSITCASATLSCTVSGLSNDVAYTFTVKASNAIGSGPESPNSNAVVPAQVPLELFRANTGIPGIYGMALSSDGENAFFITRQVNVASRIIKYEVSTSVVRDNISLAQGESASTVTIDELNGFLFVTANFTNGAGARAHALYKFNLSDMLFVAKISGLGNISAAAIAPDGQHILGLGLLSGNISTAKSVLTKIRISDLSVMGTNSAIGAMADRALSFATISNVQNVVFTARYYEGGTFGYNWVRFYSIRLSDLSGGGHWAQLRGSGQSVASSLNASNEFVSVLADGSIIKSRDFRSTTSSATLGSSISSAVFTNQGRFAVVVGYTAGSTTPKLFKFDTVEMRLVGSRDSLPSPFTPAASASDLDRKIMYTISSDSQGQLSKVFLKDVPSKPLSVSGAFGNGSALISWQPPSTPGNTIGRAFRVVASPGGESCETSSLSCRVTNLSNGTQYSFIVYPSNSEGQGLPSDPSSPVIPATVPSEPTQVTAVMGARQALVSWTPSDDDGGSAITYVVTASGSSSTCSSAATSCTVTGLTNGVTYTFSVRATNKAGSSAGVSSEETTPLSVPDPPTSILAVYGNAKATISWQPPADTGGLAIEGFTVTSSPAGRSCEASATDRGCEITGLTNGVSYTFSVVAKNSRGSSPAATSSAVTPRTTAGMPTVTSVVPGNASVQITWTAPASNGGAAILRYTAQSVENGRNCTTANGTTLTCTVTGLTNGQSYSFTVKATNSEGDSVSALPSATVIPRTVPGVPTQVVGTFGNASATISWTPPVDNGGAALVSHSVHFTNTNVLACQAVAPSNSCVVTGLANGTSYTFYARANNIAGASGFSAATPAVVPATTPGAPGIPTVSASGNGQVSLSWTVTTALGGAPITGHTITALPAAGDTRVVEVSTGNSAVMTGLTPGVSYSFSVKTNNKAGSSASSLARTFTPQAAPGAPTNILVSPGDKSVTVSWTPPVNNGGATITSYEVRNAVTNSVVCISSNPVRASCTTGTVLLNGTSYTFTVNAINGITPLFQGPASATSSPVVPRGVPTAPRIILLPSGDASATVHWSFVESLSTNQGAAITSFIVYAKNSIGATVTTCETSSPTQRLCLISGLTNGTSYFFTVAAVNSAGVGAQSALSSRIVPDRSPEIPTITSVVHGDRQVTVSWNTVQNSGSSLQSHTVTAAPGGRTCVANSPATSCAVTGLTNGSAYMFTVKSFNSSSDSAASLPSQLVTPKTMPSSPGIASVTPRNGAVNVTWTLASDGGTPITSFTVTSSPGDRQCVTSSPTARACEVSGLLNGTSYSFTVVARNSEGDSAPSAVSSPSSPRTVPSAPEFLTSSYGNGRVSLEWSTPDSDGGSPITGYLITATFAGGARTYSAAADARVFDVTSLTNGVVYTFQLFAQNLAGASPGSSGTVTLTPWGPPSAPSAITVAPRDGGVRVSWNHPSNSDPSSTTYVATANPGGQSCEVTGQNSCLVSGLTNGSPYVFSVIARNNSGSSSQSSNSISVTPADVPGAPTDVFADAGRLSAFVYWIAPVDNGGSAVVKYTVSASGSDKTCVSATTSCQIKGLTQGVTYTFTVRATNAAGEGPASEASDSLLIGQVPDAPNSVFGISGPNQVTVSWGVPANGGATIESYLVTSTPGGFICQSNGLLSCTIGGLANNVSYTFTVKAVNAIGSSDNSIASAPVIPKNIPGQPSDISTFFQNPTTLLVAWTPVINLANPVTKYQIDLLEPNFPFDVIQSVDVDQDVISVSLSGLNAGAAYRVQVTALSLTDEELGVMSLSAQNSALPAMLSPGSVSGTPSRGSVLILNSGNWVGNPLPVVSRTWFRCNNPSAGLSENLPEGCTAISGATSLTYTPTPSDVGRYILAGVRVSNSAGFVLVYTGTTSAIKAPPTLSKVQLVTGPSAVGSTLTTTIGTWLGSPAPELAIQWQRCNAKLSAGAVAQSVCLNIDGGNSGTYTLSTSDVGKFIRSAIVATNDGGSVTSFSATTATAVLQRPILSSTPAISGSAVLAQTLTSTNGTWSASPLPVFTRAWYRCTQEVEASATAHPSCSIISGATAATYKPVARDIGMFLAVAIKARNSAGESTSFSATSAAVRALPTSTVAPRVTGSYVVGNTISATSGTWTGFPTPAVSLMWQRCTSSLAVGNRTATNCVAIDGATSAQYQLSDDDAGKYLRVVVSAVNQAATTFAHSATSTQILKRPTLLQEPSILGPGGFKIRATLTATNGSWSGVPTIAYRQQWYRCIGENPAAATLQVGCTLISGATRGTYVPVSADLGSFLIVSIEAKNSASTVTRFSATTARISP